jgi:DNA-binding NarL/FixJ family response regulator
MEPRRDPVIRVLIVDDDPLVRSGLRLLLHSAEHVQVVGEATDGNELLGAIDHHHPDVVLLDLRMPKLNGLSALQLVRGQPSPPAVILLTTFDTDEHILRALRLGAAGFLVKDTAPADLVRAIELVAAGESMLSPSVTRRLIDHLSKTNDSAAERHRARQRLSDLPPRDRAIASAIAQGKSNATIATDMHLSMATIKGRVSAMLAALQLDNRVQLALLVQAADPDALESGNNLEPL